MRLIKNSATCAFCGYELVSTSVHDYRTHTCVSAGKISRQYSHETKEYTPAYPWFMVDGGLDYARRGWLEVNGVPVYEETSVYADT